MRSKSRFPALMIAFGLALLANVRADDFDAQFKAIIEAKGRTPEAERLQALFKAEWAYTLSVSPEFATVLDAGALTVLHAHREWLARLACTVIITPHASAVVASVAKTEALKIARSA